MRWREHAFNLAPWLLGSNLWVATTFVPTLSTPANDASKWLLAALPLLVLATGIFRRNMLLLLVVFPVALLLPLGTSSGTLALRDYGPFLFVMHAALWIAYIFSAARLTSNPPAVSNSTELPHLATASQSANGEIRSASPAKANFAIALAQIFFAMAILAIVLFTPNHLEFRRELFPGRARDVTTILVLGVFALNLFFALTVWIPLAEFARSGDLALHKNLSQMLSNKTFRPEFFVAVLFALVLSLSWLYLRGWPIF